MTIATGQPRMYVDEIISDKEELRKMFHRPQHELQQIYRKVIDEQFRHHYENSPAYKAIADEAEITPDTWDGKTITDIPTIDTGLFKNPVSQKRLLSIPKENVVRTYMSSGSSGGNRSVTMRDQLSIDRCTTVESVMIEEWAKTPKDSRVVLMTPPTDWSYISFAMFNAFNGAGTRPKVYLNPTPDGKLEFNKEEFGKDYAIEMQQRKPVSLASTPGAVLNLTRGLEATGRPLKIDQVHLGGGWNTKPHESPNGIPQPINLEEFGVRINKWLGEPIIIDYLGMTEQDGLLMSYDAANIKHLRPIPFVIPKIVDIENGKEITQLGVPGEMHLYGLLTNSYSAFLKTGDKAVWRDLDTPALEILGRIKDVGTENEIHGCNMGLESQLKTIQLV